MDLSIDRVCISRTSPADADSAVDASCEEVSGGKAVDACVDRVCISRTLPADADSAADASCEGASCELTSGGRAACGGDGGGVISAIPVATMRAMNSSGGIVRLLLLMVSTKLAAEYCKPHAAEFVPSVSWFVFSYVTKQR